MGAFLGIALVGKHTSKHAVREAYEKLQGKPIFKALFMGVFLEELIFRFFCIGVLTKISFLSSGVGFYTVLFVSNAIFALVHLGNYKEPRDRQTVRTLPQFIGGLMFSFIFIKYGLVASTLAHFASNAVVFSGHKLQRFNGIDVAQIVLHALLAFVSWSLMSQPLESAAIWFSGEATFALEGWSLKDFMLLALFLSSCFNLGADLLLYDKNLEVRSDKKTTSNDFGLLHLIWVLPVAIGLSLALVYGSYAFMGLFIDDIPIRVLISELFLVELSKNYSLSSAQRAFWVGLPTSYILICIVEALGFWGAGWYLLISIVIGIPHLVLKYYND